MGDFDIAAKALLREEPAAFVRLALPGREIKAIEPDETEFQALERRMDKLLRVNLVGEPEPVCLHVEVEAVWGADVPRRVFGRWSLAHQTRPSLRSFVLVLRPGDHQGEPHGEYVVTVLGKRVLSFGFDVVCAWNLKATELLTQRDPGLLPLVPFSEGASEARVEEAFTALAADSGRRGVELQVVLATFSGQVFPGISWLDRIGEETLMESVVYQEIIARGVAKGRLEGRREIVAGQLRLRLGKSKRTEALVTRLALCTEAALDKIGALLVGSKKKAVLVVAIERLMPEKA